MKKPTLYDYLPPVLVSVSESARKEVFVWSPDTDALIFLLDFASFGHVDERTGLQLLKPSFAKTTLLVA